MIQGLIHQKIIFQPAKLENSFRFSFEYPHEEYFIPTRDGEWIHALYFQPKSDHKGTIFYFHGNSGNLQKWGLIAEDFIQLGFSVLMMDYRGFGKSTGVPSEDTLYEDAEVLIEWARENLSYFNPVFYGRSLGTAVASYLASTYQPGTLILETPFDQLYNVIWPIARPILKIMPIEYKFPTIEFVSAYQGRTIVFHGTNDLIIPLKSALNLKTALNPTDEFFIIEGGNHWNLRKFEIYHEKLKSVLIQ